MKNLDIHPSKQLGIPDNAPVAAAILRPVLFMNEGVVWCVLGDNLNTAITGLGDNVEDALEDWEDTLKERINAEDAEDEVVAEVLTELASYREKMSARNVQEFMDQFRPVRR